MKVYFSGSRLYADKFKEQYEKIRQSLVKLGCQIIDMSVAGVAKDVYEIDDKEKKKRYSQFLKNLDKGDLSLFEATYPSTISIGHEITLAIQKGKPVIIMYREGTENEPKMFRGLDSEKVIWVAYSDTNIQARVKEALEKAMSMADVRFNFFVSPKLLNYLDFVSKKRMIPRSVFLRDLIEREMKKDKEFKSE